MKKPSKGSRVKAVPDSKNQHLRELKSHKYTGSTDHPLPYPFRLYFRDKVQPLLKLKGYKRREKQELAAWLVHALIVAQKCGATVSDSRKCSKPGVRQRVEVWDAIESAGLCVKSVGSEFSKKSTRYYATPKLTKLKEKWKLETLVDLDLQRNSEVDPSTAHSLVYLHTGHIDLATGEPLLGKNKKQAIDLKRTSSEIGLNMVQALENVVEAFNENNLSHAWMVKIVDPETGRTRSEPLNPCLRMIHCGAFYRAMRFYSWSYLSGQRLSKEQRENILIDGEPVTELDFKASILRIMYHLRGFDPKGDLYRPKLIFPKSYKKASVAERKILRGFVKDATLRCLNVQSRKKAHSSLGKLLKETNRTDREFVLSAMQKDGLDIAGVAASIVSAHAIDQQTLFNGQTQCGIADLFFRGEGLKFITEESKRMRLLLQIFTKARKPALMIHDAVVCKRSDAKFAKRAMIDAHQAMFTTLAVPGIQREF